MFYLLQFVFTASTLAFKKFSKNKQNTEVSRYAIQASKLKRN